MDAVIKAADAGDRKSLCRASGYLVMLERRLLDFYEQHQTGCVIDIALIEEQQKKVKRAEGLRDSTARSCEAN